MSARIPIPKVATNESKSTLNPSQQEGVSAIVDIGDVSIMPPKQHSNMRVRYVNRGKARPQPYYLDE